MQIQSIIIANNAFLVYFSFLAFLQRLYLITELCRDLKLEHLRGFLHLASQAGDLLLFFALATQLFLAARGHIRGDLDNILHLFMHRPGDNPVAPATAEKKATVFSATSILRSGSYPYS